MLLENGDRIVFAGDSVTDMGSANPVARGFLKASEMDMLERLKIY